MEEENNKVAFYKNKKVMIPAVLLLLTALVSAMVLYSSSVGTITVNEALNQTVASFSVSGFPNETKTYNFTVTNDGSNSLSTLVAWAEQTNANAVNYTTDMPKTVALSSGSNTVPISFTFASGSPVGIFNGTVTFNRL